MPRSLTITALLVPVEGDPEVRTVAVDPAAYEDTLGGAYTRAGAGAGAVVYAGSPSLPLFASPGEGSNLNAAAILARHGVSHNVCDLTGPVLITGEPDADGWDTSIPHRWARDALPAPSRRT